MENKEASLNDSHLSESYTIEILRIIKEAQQTHGLRHGDYQRYRQYLARRIARIRKSLHFPMFPHSSKQNKAQPKTVTVERVVDARFLYLPLMDAERKWAYAMQLKSEANTEPRKRFHMIRRLKKAVQCSDLLSQLCEIDKCDARTKLESQAYNSWMKASLQFELENWKLAIELFTNASTIYEKLAAAVVDDISEIYRQRVEEITPSIRYCSYNIGDESAMADLMHMRVKIGGQQDPLTSRLDELIEKTREKQSATLSEITWRGRTVPVRNEKVRVFLLSARGLEEQLNEASGTDSRLSIYESLLKELIEAQASLKEELNEDPALKAILRGQVEDQATVPNSIYLHTYLAYIRQTRTVERNQLMIENLRKNLPGQRAPDEPRAKITKPQDLARLYDTIIQNLAEIPNLPGIGDPETFNQELSGQISAYKAFRCFYVAQTYANAKKWAEALALYEQVLCYAKSAFQELDDSSKSKSLKTELSDLSKDVDGLKYSCHASSILDADDLAFQMPKINLKNDKPLIDRLETFGEDAHLLGKHPRLAHFPPEFRPVACKPLFFDLALNHVELPSLDDRLDTSKAGGGLTGYLKGWLWGGKK